MPMDTPVSPEQLVSLLRLGLPNQDSDSDIKNLRYVIYARKSSESAEKQARSLGDQVLECREKAEDLGLKVVGPPIQEPSSASEPDIRVKFRAMLDDIKKGKYDGIIAWHPDRLARNMKEAGEIIDLLDKGIIKDLKFVSSFFENSPTGKMLLGISFVLSKQYSDQLGHNVRRGNKRSIEEGKYIGNKAPHGYYKDREQYLRPDDENFILIQKAFDMRINGQRTLNEIAQFLNDNNYSVKKSDGKHVPYKMTKNRVSDFLKNPVYTGVLVHGENIANLTELFNFFPAITVEQFLTINKQSDLNSSLVNSNFQLANIHQKHRKADLLRGMILCGECHENLSTGITTKKKGKQQHYFFYRCNTTGCPRKDKSTRAKVIMEFVYDFLDRFDLATKEVYDYFLEDMQTVQKQNAKEYERKLRVLTKNRQSLKHKETRLKDYIPQEEDAAIRRDYKADLKNTTKAIVDFDQKIEAVREAINQNKTVIVTYQEFLELFQNLAQKLKKVEKMDGLDFLLRKIFSNFTVKDGKVAEYKLKPPFAGVVEKHLVLNGGDDGTQLGTITAL